MILVKNVLTLFSKQVKDTLKNPPVLILFLVYPLISMVMTQAMQNPDISKNYFVAIFATMHCIFTPIVSTASILSEEKEKNTLRVLILSNVTLREYLISIGGFVFLSTILSGCLFFLSLEANLTEALLFIVYMGIGSCLSVLLGMCIGLLARNASAANGFAVPVGMVFAFLPMLSSFNTGIKSFSRFTFGQQVSWLIAGEPLTVFGTITIVANAILFLSLYILLYKKSLRDE